jgi:hypothetical protein
MFVVSADSIGIMVIAHDVNDIRVLLCCQQQRQVKQADEYFFHAAAGILFLRY